MKKVLRQQAKEKKGTQQTQLGSEDRNQSKERGRRRGEDKKSRGGATRDRGRGREGRMKVQLL